MKEGIKFITNSAYLALFIAVLSLSSCTNSTKKTESVEVAEVEEVAPKSVGVQVYSARDALKEDFKGTMKKLADIGYKYVEAYGLGTDGTMYGMAPAEYKRIVDSLGMTVISSHASYFTPEEAPVVLKAAQEAGLKYVMVPWLNNELRTDYAAVADNLNKVGEIFKGSGVQLGYHNHDFEFELTEDGQVPLEIMLNNTDPELVTFQADLYWVTKAGFDPMALINKFPGRFSSFHIKDANDSLAQTTIGTGIIDFTTILKSKDVSGWEYYFVEDERTDDPLGNLKADFDNFSKLDF